MCASLGLASLVACAPAHRPRPPVPPTLSAIPTPPGFDRDCAAQRTAYAVTLFRRGQGGAGTDLVVHCADAVRVPASITKLAALSVILDAVRADDLDLDAPVIISAHAAAQGGSGLPKHLKAGDTLPLRDLLKAVAITSDNRAVVAAAERVAGTETAFVERMNAKAAALGLTGTHFGNASGLPDWKDGARYAGSAPPNLTTAHDMQKLIRAVVLASPYYRAIARLPVATVDRQTVHDHNPLLAGRPPHGAERCIVAIPGVVGGKTGFTDAGFNNVLDIALPDGDALVVTYIGARSALDRDVRILDLLRQARAQLAAVPVVPMPAVSYVNDLPRCGAPGALHRMPAGPTLGG